MNQSGTVSDAADDAAELQPEDRTPIEGLADDRRRPWNQWRFDPEPETIENVQNELIFEGKRRTPFLFRFFTLLILSTFISSFGLISNSSAVVIAAMIVAPLMTPIMGIAVGLVGGNYRRQLESGGLVVVATVVISVQAIVIAFMVPDPAVIPDQILSRTDPTLIDLLIAIAAGAAGGYSIVRREASSALAGVAIGVSLVPPLCSYGILLAWGEPDLADGALLLYLTNLAAIIFTGAIVFSIVGFLPINRLGTLPGRIKIGLAAASIAIIIVAIPLYLQTEDVLTKSTDQQTVSGIVNDALDGTDFVLMDYSTDGNNLTLSIGGPSGSLETPPTSAQDLANQIGEALGEPVDLEVRLYPYGSFPASSTPVE